MTTTPIGSLAGTLRKNCDPRPKPCPRKRPRVRIPCLSSVGLPACWLRALPRLLEKRAKKHWQGIIPFGLSPVAEQGGALVMEFA